ncbi:MAG: hypothetical protein ABIF71_11410 [Planctomycetota bacterium]
MQVVRLVIVSLLAGVLPVYPMAPWELTGTGALLQDAIGAGNDTTPILGGSFEAERERAGRVMIPVVMVEPPPAPATEPDGGGPVYFTQAVAVPGDAPCVDAGPDRYGAVGRTMTLEVQGRLPDETRVNWSFISGPAAVIDDPGAMLTTFSPPIEGVYRILLEAVFPGGEVAADTVLCVIDAPGTNRIPGADAGPDLVVVWQPDAWIPVTGGGYDGDDDQLAYAWRQVAGPAVTVHFARTETMEFTPPAPGTYSFELTVNDGRADSVPDAMTVVCTLTDDMPPVATGEDVRITEAALPCVVMLDGTSSRDPEGSGLTWSWEQVEGPPVALSGADTAAPCFMCTREGNYWFRLTVDDGLNRSLPEEVSVAVTTGSDDAPYGCLPGSGGTPAGGLYLLAAGCWFMLRRKFNV